MKRLNLCVVLALLCLCFSAGAALGISDQAVLMANQADLWKLEEPSDPWGILVTDLDQNGRNEIITAVTQGTGLYTTFRIFEVNEAGDRLVPIEQNREEGSSAPDIMVSNTSCYEDKDSGRFYYIFDDILRNGYAENYESKYAAYIEDGSWHEELLAAKETLYTDETNFTVHCHDASGAEIDEAQYDAIAGRVFPELPKSLACFNWYMTNSENFDALTYEKLVILLDKLQAGICVNPGL